MVMTAIVPPNMEHLIECQLLQFAWHKPKPVKTLHRRFVKRSCLGSIYTELIVDQVYGYGVVPAVCKCLYTRLYSDGDGIDDCN